MTVAVCVECGEIKHGAFNTCRACGMRPESEVDLAYSMALTDRHLDAEILERISQSMKSGDPRPIFPPEQEENFRREVRRVMPRLAELYGEEPEPDDEDPATAAMCILCGAMKDGAFSDCEACGAGPVSEAEFACSLAYSSEFIVHEALKRLSRAVLNGEPRPELNEDEQARFLKLVRDRREEIVQETGYAPGPDEQETLPEPAAAQPFRADGDLSVAVCVKCGAMKRGAFSICEACGFRPDTDIDLAYSFAFTDRFVEREALEQISELMLSGKPRPDLDAEQEAMFLKALQDRRAADRDRQ